MSTITLSAEQQAVVNEALTGNSNIACIAAAGSGKTTTLIETVLALAASGIPRYALRVVAFNRTAAEGFCDRLESANQKKFARVWRELPNGERYIDRKEDVAITFDSWFPRLDGRDWFLDLQRIDDEVCPRNKKRPSACLDFSSNELRNYVWEQAGKKANIDTKTDWFIPDRLPQELQDAFYSDEPNKELHASAQRKVVEGRNFRVCDDLHKSLCNFGITPGEAPDERLPFCSTARVRKLFAAFDEVCSSLGVWTFGQVVLSLLRKVRNGGEALASLRREFSKHRFVIIDEAQDNSEAQNEIIQALCWPASPKGPRLLMVGDPRQCIYEWRGASPEQLVEFASQPTTRRLDLTVNRRSLKAIVDIGNAYVRGLNYGPDCVSHRHGESVVVGLTGEPITWSRCLGAIEQLSGKGRSMAVLAFTNNSVRAYSRSLFLVGVPHLLAGGGLPGAGDVDQVVRAIGSHSQPGFDARMRSALIRWNVEGLGYHRTLLCVARVRLLDGPGLEAWYRTYAKACYSSEVCVSTVHKAKGLEWNTVILDAALGGGADAARRLQYVAVTRAMNDLVVFGLPDEEKVRNREEDEEYVSPRLYRQSYMFDIRE